MFRIEHNVETNEIKQIELTADEIKDYKAREAKDKADAEKLQAELDAKAQAKAELLAKLGITEDEAKLLLS